MTTVGEYFAGALIRGIDEGIGNEGIVQSLHVTPADGALELPIGSIGPDGAVGAAAIPFRWEGDVADVAALTALSANLGPVHAGKAWRVLSTNALMYWDGRVFEIFPDAFGGTGPQGVPNSLSIGTVTTGAAGSDLVVSITGDPPSQAVNLTVPRGVQGVKGPDGPPGPITGASDFNGAVTRTEGMVPLWSAATSKWVPTPYPGWRGPWTITEGEAWNGAAGFVASASGLSTSPFTIAQLAIPAQDTAWRPFVTGGAVVRTAAGDATSRVDIEACIGSASGQIVALGVGMPYAVDAFARMQPQFQTSAMTPASSVGVIAAGVATTLHIVIRRNLGTANFNYTRTGAHVAAWAVPVTGAP
ncbi:MULTISPECIES: hypothetical protein [Nocardia]|uniref:hypothetical protein n=1 Tax=Nocardia TaxID=1817 RepID=UPI0007A526D5|nr:MULTISPECIES: hypothetical protein [Nocardia]